MDELVLAHIDLPRAVASKLSAHFTRCGLEFEDAVQEGCIALMAAARSYRPDAVAEGTFKGWAWLKIDGAIRDAARIADKQHNLRSRREATAGEAHRRGHSLDEAWTVNQFGNVETFGALTPDPRVDVVRDVERDDSFVWALRVMDMVLSDREATVVRLNVMGDFTQQEIGDMFGVTEARISQIRTLALKKLRASGPVRAVAA